MSLRQVLNVTYAWMLEGREHHRETVDTWLAGKPLPAPSSLPRGVEHGTFADLQAMAAMTIGAR